MIVNYFAEGVEAELVVISIKQKAIDLSKETCDHKVWTFWANNKLTTEGNSSDK